MTKAKKPMGYRYRFTRENYATRRGEESTHAKLTDEDVLEIREARGNYDGRRSDPGTGTPLKDLAARYGVSLSVISNVARGVKWKHVKEPS